MQHLRFMTWCPRSVSGLHLPAFAASEAGLFAERGLDVEFVPASNAPEAVAAGRADFALTSALHVLSAQTPARWLPVRFVAAFHQRNPIVGVVRADSGRLTPADLAGARVASWSMPWYARECAGAMSHMKVGAPVLVDTPGGLDQALGSGAVDVLPMWMDDTAPAKAQGMVLSHRGASFGVRAIALDIPVYSTGLIASDRIALDVVRRVREAITAGHELQRDRPELGLAAFSRCFPDVSDGHARVSWSLYEPYANDGAAAGSMDAARWRDTLAHLARTHGLSTFREDRVYRPELLSA